VLPNTYLFFVEVPGIEATSAQMWQLSLQMQMQRQNPRMGNPAQPVLPPPPPIDPNGAPRMSNPEKEYSEFTRQSLVDTMLDNAFGLPLKEGQTLTVVVGVADDVPTTAIAATPRKLYLTMKSEDLLALRQGKITRDEARALIKESRY
jgi:hypothetical protein